MVGLLTEVLLRRLPARDDRLQENRVLVLHERHQVHVVLAPDDEDALAGVGEVDRELRQRAGPGRSYRAGDRRRLARRSTARAVSGASGRSFWRMAVAVVSSAAASSRFP